MPDLPAPFRRRPEIDGLRALAVLAVVLWQAGVPGFGGGFAGIDVLLVVSGFLVTGVVTRRFDGGRLSVMSFVIARVRRVVPALAVVMAACIPFALLWMRPSELAQFSRSLVATTLFVSNAHFLTTGDPFAPASELRPLLHTWSLAVGAQFFLLYLPLLWALLKWRRRWLQPVLACAAAASLAVALTTADSQPAAAYLTLSARAWELLLGAWLALRSRPPATAGRQPPRAQGEWPALLGLAAIAIAVCGLARGAGAPVGWTLLPALGTALVLVRAQPRNFVGALLGWRPLVAAGALSYGLYLWHQPVLAFARLRSIDPPGWPLQLALVLLAAALAALTRHFVEQPFRRRGHRRSRRGLPPLLRHRPARGASADRSRRTGSAVKARRAGVFGRVRRGAGGGRIGRRETLAWTAMAASTFIVLGTAGKAMDASAWSGPAMAEADKVRTAAHSRCHTSARRSAEDLAAGNVCTLGTRQVAPTFAVIGDSQAGSLFEALHREAMLHGKAFQAVSGPDCAPLLNGFHLGNAQQRACRALIDAAFERVLASPQLLTVVLVADWSRYAEFDRRSGATVLAGDREGDAARPADQPVVFARALAASVARVRAAGKTVLVVLPVPVFDRPVLATVVKQRLYAPNDPPPTATVAEQAALNRTVLRIFAGQADLLAMPTEDLFCRDGVCRSVDAGGRILFSDGRHLTEDGAQRVAERLLRAMRLGTPL